MYTRSPAKRLLMLTSAVLLLLAVCLVLRTKPRSTWTQSPLVDTAISGWLKGNDGALSALADTFRRSTDGDQAVILESLSDYLNIGREARVRQACARVMAWCGPSAGKPLAKALENDPDQEVKLEAALALAQAGTESELPQLLRAALRDTGPSGEMGRISIAAIRSIGEIGGPMAGRILRELWGQEGMSSNARALIIVSIGAVKDLANLDFLLSVESQAGQMQGPAVLALRTIAEANAGKEAVVARIRPIMRKRIADQNDVIRGDAIACLGSIGDSQDIREIEKLIEKESNPRVRVTATFAIDSIRERAGLER